MQYTRTCVKSYFRQLVDSLKEKNTLPVYDRFFSGAKAGSKKNPLKTGQLRNPGEKCRAFNLADDIVKFVPTNTNR